ncbi:MAG: LysM peptidoglycan-binding domain-containing protein [Patescibacteria group bacterium]
MREKWTNRNRAPLVSVPYRRRAGVIIASLAMLASGCSIFSGETDEKSSEPPVVSPTPTPTAVVQEPKIESSVPPASGEDAIAETRPAVTILNGPSALDGESSASIHVFGAIVREFPSDDRGSGLEIACSAPAGGLEGIAPKDTYIVQSGDVLGLIAENKRPNVAYTDPENPFDLGYINMLREANDIDRNIIRPGEELLIPNACTVTNITVDEFGGVFATQRWIDSLETVDTFADPASPRHDDPAPEGIARILGEDIFENSFSIVRPNQGAVVECVIGEDHQVQAGDTAVKLANRYVADESRMSLDFNGINPWSLFIDWNMLRDGAAIDPEDRDLVRLGAYVQTLTDCRIDVFTYSSGQMVVRIDRYPVDDESAAEVYVLGENGMFIENSAG